MNNKLLVFSLSLIIILLNIDAAAQNSRILKGADKSYNQALSDLKKKNYKEASAGLVIAVDNIPADVDSRKYQLVRLDAASKLVELHFNQVEELKKACKYLDIFTEDLNRMKSDDNLKAKDIHKYLQLEKDFEQYVRKCNGLRSIDDKKKDFEKRFENEFEEIAK